MEENSEILKPPMEPSVAGQDEGIDPPIEKLNPASFKTLPKFSGFEKVESKPLAHDFLLEHQPKEEKMYMFKTVKPEDGVAILGMLPQDMLQERTFSVSLTSVLGTQIDEDEQRTLQDEYEITGNSGQINIKQKGTKGNVISLNRKGDGIATVVASMAPSVIAVRFDRLRKASPFVSEILDRVGIPEKTEAVEEAAQRMIEKDQQERDRLSKIQPETTGICEDLPVERVDDSRTVVIGQKGYAFGHPNFPGRSILEIYGAGPCVGLFARNPNTGLSFATHLDRSESVKEAMRFIKQELGEEEAELVIYGGQDDPGEALKAGGSRATLAAIEEERGDMKVIGKDTLGDKTRRLALDTATGRYFIPDENFKVEEPTATQLIQLRVNNLSSQLANDGIPLYELYKFLDK